MWGPNSVFKNKTASDYYAELFFNYFDDAGQLKGRCIRLIYIQPNTAGFKARESYQFTGAEEFIESFELAEPGKEFGMYSKATLRKIK